MIPESEKDQDVAETPDGNGVAKPVDWTDFRDHIATADKDGRRRWLYPKKPSGTWHQRRVWFAVVLIVILFAGPWIRIQGNPLLMFNLIERKFSILGQMFWPQDSILFAVAMLIFITGIIVFTTAFGRLWCGWACPQTVMMEMVFRKLEYLIDGDSAEQKALAAAPWTVRKLVRRVFKHAVFYGLSFVIGNTLLAYIIGSDALLQIQFDDPRNHVTGLTFMVLFSTLFYLIFARFREQACTFICPYGRFQSAALDENTLLVAYDRRRGEARAPLRRGESVAQRASAGLGDCISCRQCVAVCPTGIDIRDGTQMECVNCTACIDACDQVMDKIGRPRGLVRFASQNNIEKGEPQRFTRRMGMYLVVLASLITLFLVLVFTRAPVETTFLRAQGALYQPGPDDTIGNLYSVKIINKAHHDIPVELQLDGIEGTLRVMGVGPLVAPKESFVQTSVMVYLPKKVLTGSTTSVRISVVSGGKRLERIRTMFVGPRDAD
jgi:cytochrome c oxidase accessory protein FixG